MLFHFDVHLVINCSSRDYTAIANVVCLDHVIMWVCEINLMVNLLLRALLTLVYRLHFARTGGLGGIGTRNILLVKYMGCVCV